MNPSLSPVQKALHAADQTRDLEISPGALDVAPRIFKARFGDRPALIVADQNTFAAAGQRVLRALAAAGCACVKPFIFTDRDLHAEYRHVTALERAFRKHEAVPVAVGTGTINDLSKLAAFQTGRQYMAVATAASMDGHTAFGASVIHKGFKKNFDCPAPLAVVADLEVICAAPAELNAAGYADLLAKTIAGADWVLADTLGIEEIHRRAWDIVQGSFRQAVANPAGVRKGARPAMIQLTRGLMLSGLAMQCARSSRVAAGAEHQFSHLWDMQHHTHKRKIPFHGFKVGIGTLAMAALYEFLFDQPIQALDIDRCCRKWPGPAVRNRTIRRMFGNTELTGVALTESAAKAVDRNGLRRHLLELKAVWPGLRRRLRARLMPFDEIRQKLVSAGAPVEPEQIGISRERLRRSFWEAFYIRRRFTGLDLAARTALLEPALDHIFGPDGRWPCSKAGRG